MAYNAGGLSTLSDNGLALPARPSSSQKKKAKSGKPVSFIRKSITITRTRKKQGPAVVDDKMRKLLYTYRAELRPLLDAIRFVESSNREDCPDGDGGASIGPFQISEHYHLDAWKNKRTYSWLSCRELEHAENTVVAYWMRYCSDALSKRDWEILAKIHNGGPQGPRREKTAYYWSKVSKYLEQLYVPPALPSRSEVSHPSSKCSSFTTNLDRKFHGKLINVGLKMSAAPERQKPIVNKRRKAKRFALADISSTVNMQHLGVECGREGLKGPKGSVTTSPDEANVDRRIEERIGFDLTIQHLGMECRYLQQISEAASENQIPNEPLNTRTTMAIEIAPEDSCSRLLEGGEAHDNLQLYEKSQSGSPIDGLVIEQKKINEGATCIQRWTEYEEGHRSSQEYWRTPESFGASLQEGSLDMLYSTDLPAQKEEEILTELAQLLPLNLCDMVNTRGNGSFEFPQTAPDFEYATPDLKIRPHKRVTEVTVKKELESSAATPVVKMRSYSAIFDATEATPQTKVESPLSPSMETDLLSELAELFHLPHPANFTQDENLGDVAQDSKADLNLADFLLEISEHSTSVEYAKAMFSCENVLLERLCEAVSIREESLDESVKRLNDDIRLPSATVMDEPQSERTSLPSFSACSCHCSSGNRLASSSLKRLCAVWEEQNVDLLTRSLRLKMLTSRTASEGSKTQTPCIAWEIQALQNSSKSMKAQKAAKELIKQQRDMIYVNIGSYATKNERHRLYSRWGIRRLATGRLKKLVYDLLWKDPKRYPESAELVTQYL